MFKSTHIFAVLVILLLSSSHISIAQTLKTEEPKEEPLIISPAAISALSSIAQMRAVMNQKYGIDVEELIDASTNLTDTDGDGLPDSVESILGTDYNNSDSDYDQLNDSFEARNNLDPLDPDSNHDGMPDYHEVIGVDLDLDNDSFPNQWDLDNDGDGVMDSVDSSPFAKTDLSDVFTFDIKGDGKPTNIDFQLRPNNPKHLTLPTGAWDWPEDNQGIIRDLDNSDHDISIVPLLEFTADTLPPQAIMHDYGITIDGDKAIIPLLPVQELGLTTALKGKMFYPESTNLDIQASARLLWQINVNTDSARDKIQIKSGTDFITLNNVSKELITTAVNDSCSEFIIVNLGEDRIALKDCNGLYAYVNGDKLLSNASVIDNNAIFNVTGDKKLSLIANNGKYLSVEGGILTANSTAEYVFDTIKVGNIIDSQTVTLVTYDEEFMFTGLTVEESHGTDVGIYYSSEKNNTMAAGVVMSYSFLRDDNTVYDMMDEFSDRNVDNMESVEESFSHRHTALYTMASVLTPNVLDDLPDNEVLPVIHAFEDHSKLTQLNTTGSHLDLDVRDEPLVTTKSMQMNWYNTSQDSILAADDIISKLERWGSGKPELELTSFIAIILTWSFGESVVTKIDKDFTVFEGLEGQDVLGDIQLYGIENLVIIRDMTKKQSTYSIVHFFTDAKIADLYKKHGTFKQTIKALEKLGKGTKGVKALNAISKVGKAVAILGIIIEVGVSLWTWFAIADSYNYSSFGVAFAFMNLLTTLGYALFYIALAAIPVIGWIFAAVVAILDAIFGFGEALINQIVDWITKTDIRSNVDLRFKGNSMEIDDLDGNGNDAGDVISFVSKIDGITTKTSHGNDDDIRQSYIRPRYALDEHSYKFGPWLYTKYFSNWSSYSNQTGDSVTTAANKTTPYEVGIDLEPKRGLINLPVPILLKSDYKIYYDNCVWVFFTYVCSRDSQTDTAISDLTTLYVDIMPDNLDDFMWGWWRYAQDRDGDGLTTSEDNYDWSWDADGDGISDGYEKELGTDDGHADTDRDGLNDRMEIYYGTDPLSWDTDGDRMEDYLEIKGWMISLNYSSVMFNMTVHSDPLNNDSDGDGIDDQMERWSNLNPMSKDTNGDRIPDVARPKYVTYVSFEDEWVGFDALRAIDVDNRGFVYILDGAWRENRSIYKYDTHGNHITDWTVNNHSTDVTSDYSGNVYTLVGETYYSNDSPYIQKFDTDGNYLDRFNLTFDIPWAAGIEVDTDGNIYVSNPDEYKVPGGPYPTRIGCVHKLDSNGSEIIRFCNESMSNTLAIDVSAEHTYAIGNVDNSGSDPITKYLKNGTYIKQWGGYGSAPGNFTTPYGIATDPRGFVYVADTGNHRIQKFDDEGYFIMRWGGYGNATCPPAEPDCECTVGNCEFNEPNGIAVDKDLHVYVTDEKNDRVTKFSQFTEVDYYNWTLSNLTDTDQDGLMDYQEEAGYFITFTTVNGTFTENVSSSFLMKDTDFDGLDDSEEYELLSNPVAIDTDGDMLNDYIEASIGTNLSHYDTDGDQLGDNEELTFGSSPFIADTDGEGLLDYLEFQFLSDPNMNDTDGDGLTDYEEYLLNTSMIKADTDGDSVTDAHERFLGADPNKKDSDNDNLSDVYEIFINTSITGNDTDNDGILDGVEVMRMIDPLKNDTDNDGIPDGSELESGTDPRDADSDDDGIIDSSDFDSGGKHVDDIILSYDIEYPDFISALEDYTNVTIALPATLETTHKTAPYIVIVAKPDNSTVIGSIVYDLLKDTGDVLTDMMSDQPTMAVRYGVWQPSQTVIILNQPTLSSHFDVLNEFKGKVVTKIHNSVSIDYSVPRDSIRIDFMDVMKETGSYVLADLDDNITASVRLRGYNDSTIPDSLPAKSSIGRYVEFTVNDKLNQSSDIIDEGYIIMFYTAKDLDRDGNGLSGDPDDVDETKLALYVYENGWKKLSKSLDWVSDMGIDTTDTERYGTQYEGYIWAKVSHLSVYGINEEKSSSHKSGSGGGGGGSSYTYGVIDRSNYTNTPEHSEDKKSTINSDNDEIEDKAAKLIDNVFNKIKPPTVSRSNEVSNSEILVLALIVIGLFVLLGITFKKPKRPNK